MCTDTCNWNIFAVLCTIFAICGIHWTISSQIHYKTWSRLIVVFFLWLIYGRCAIETLITPLCFQRVGNLAWGCVAISSELKHFIRDGSLWRLSPKEESLIQESDEDQRVSPSQGYISSKGCWGDKEQMQVLGRAVKLPRRHFGLSQWTSGFQLSWEVTQAEAGFWWHCLYVIPAR